MMDLAEPTQRSFTLRPIGSRDRLTILSIPGSLSQFTFQPRMGRIALAQGAQVLGARTTLDLQSPNGARLAYPEHAPLGLAPGGFRLPSQG